MKNFGVSGYKKKSKAQLLKAIDECQSLSQLFALIQHENIVIRMHSQSGASNLTPQKLTPNEIISKKDTPLYVYCLSGGRATGAVSAFKKMGYTNVQNIGGIQNFNGQIVMR